MHDNLFVFLSIIMKWGYLGFVLLCFHYFLTLTDSFKEKNKLISDQNEQINNWNKWVHAVS